MFWGFPFVFLSCHENDSQLVECLAGLLEPLPVEIGLEKMQMVIRQGAAKVGLENTKPLPDMGQVFNLFEFCKISRHLTYLNS